MILLWGPNGEARASCVHYTCLLHHICAKQELANLINALGRWDAYPGPHFLDAFCNSVLRRLGRFTPQGLANVLHALGKLGHYPGPDWMSRVVDRCLALVTDFTAQGLAMVLCGLSNLRFHPGDGALDVVVASVTKRAAELDQQYLAMVWWGLGNLEYAPSSAFWQACRERVAWHRILDRLSLFEAGTLLYALALTDSPASRPFLGPLIRRACSGLEARAWVAGRRMDLETESALRQLHQVFMYIETLRATTGMENEEVEEDREILPGLNVRLQRQFGALIASAWRDSAEHLLSGRVQTSAFQRDVQTAAESLDFCCLSEARDGPFVLDIVVPPNPVSVELKEEMGRGGFFVGCNWTYSLCIVCACMHAGQGGGGAARGDRGGRPQPPPCQ